MPDNTKQTTPAAEAPAKSERFKGQVRATQRGYAMNSLREPGEEFYFEGVLGSWMEAVEQGKAAK